MNLSYNWLKEYFDAPKDITPEKIGDILTLHTVEVEGIRLEEDKFSNIVVGKILEVNPHPNADRLRLAIVDIGKEKLNIVCGAPNIEPGQLVPVALIGSVLPNGLEIKEAKVRGEISKGMLCAKDELVLGEDHSGIMILENAKIGQALADYLNQDDVVLEVDNKSLSNRPDLWGHIGIAREIAAILGVKFKGAQNKLESITKDIGSNDNLKIKVEDFMLCPRYMAIVIDSIVIKPSPNWIKEKLIACGVRPINNIVDVTNYVMLETGQPLHAFDRKLVDRIVVRAAKKNEKMDTLDGQPRELDENTIVIADSKKPIAIAGVMGGANSEISSNTKKIVIESANFNYVSVRKTSDRMSLRTDASQRFEKGLDPNLCEIGLSRAAELILKVCPDARVVTKVLDEKKFDLKTGPIFIKLDWIRKIIGVEIEDGKIIDILRNLGFGIKENGDEIEVNIPSWRATRDVAIKEDIVEEVARVFGYNNIPSKLPSIKIEPPLQFEEKQIERRIKDTLSRNAGLFEVYNYSFVGEDQLEKMGLSFENHIRLLNPIAKQHTLMRQSLIPNLFECVKVNQAKFESVKVFETGNVFLSHGGELEKGDSEEKLPYQEKRIGIVIGENSNNDAYGEVKSVLETLFNEFKLDIGYTKLEQNINWSVNNFSTKINIVDKKGQVLLENIGEINVVEKKVSKSIGLKKAVAVAEIYFNEIVKAIQEKGVITFNEPSKFPSATRDLAFVVSDKVAFSDIQFEIFGYNDMIKEVELFDIYQGDKLGKGKKNLAFHVVYRAEKTLTSKEVDSLQEGLLKKLEEKFEAKIRNF